MLVGINESGKSNILRALSLLDEEVEVDNYDRREEIDDELRSDKAYVWFVFRLDESEHKDFREKVATKILAGRNGLRLEFGRTKGSEKTLLDVLGSISEVLYCVDVIARTKAPSYWALPKDLKLSSDWKKPSAACPNELKVSDGNGKSIAVKSMTLIHWPTYSAQIPTSCVEPATTEDLERTCGRVLMELLKENLPTVIKWEYSERSILPGFVDYAQFKANPGSVIPLQNMFELQGNENITEVLKRAEGTDKGLANEFKRVASKTSAFLRDAWKEHKTLQVELLPQGTKISIGIKDKYNLFNLSQRSEGFKRFVTFLLLVGAKQRAGNLKNCLLLIDEPEIGLHPTGCRNLMKELLRLSTDNKVVYSTHSIFMIDAEQIDRHILVEKSDELTTAKAVGASELLQEEVLLKALGTSVFEFLRTKNIIFEGFYDKVLFQTALKKYGKKKPMNDVGLCHGHGAPQIRKFAPIFDAGERSFIVVSDGDAAALAAQKSYRQGKFSGEWFTYGELGNSRAITGEDFVKAEVIQKSVAALAKNHVKVSTTPLPALPESNRLNAVRGWLTSCGCGDEETKDFLSNLKASLFDGLKLNEIEDDYFEMLQVIKTKII